MKTLLLQLEGILIGSSCVADTSLLKECKNIKVYITFELKALYPWVILSVHTTLQSEQSEHKFEANKSKLSEIFVMED